MLMFEVMLLVVWAVGAAVVAAVDADAFHGTAS